MRTTRWAPVNGVLNTLTRPASRDSLLDLSHVKHRPNTDVSASTSYAGTCTRFFVSTPKLPASDEDRAAANKNPSHWNIPKDKLAQRDFFFDVLNVSATRRDAKQYLARFKSPAEQKSPKSASDEQDRRVAAPRRLEQRLARTGVNLGEFYAPTKAIAQSPKFTQQKDVQDKLLPKDDELIHVALLSIRAPQLIDQKSLDGIALTLAQLVRLDMQIVLTFDCSDLFSEGRVPKLPHQQVYQKQADRIVRALEKYNNGGARYVDSALAFTSGQATADTARLQSAVELSIPKLVIEPLKRTTIPVIPALAYTESFQNVPVPMVDVMLGLTKALSGIQPVTALGETVEEARDHTPSVATTLDRLILVDPLGGVPSLTRGDGSHVFVNLQQEYKDIASELRASDVFSMQTINQHVQNLDTLRHCLALLPPSTSALVISPEEAASSSQPSAPDSESVGISTRRTKNPLIHNLLTNKPVISSSLPVARLSSPNNGHTPLSSAPSRSTLVKKGMPLTMIPDPRVQPWLPPANGETTISLENHPDISFPRLVSLIEDSFRRPLDVPAYLRRIQNRIAGIIIAGEYEGGAIFTWEMPPLSTSEGSEDVARLVPYLDKFAVLQRSQGSSGVADMLFQAMVRSCFPDGVCWRSRQENPVNKWYFERSRGTWKLNDSQWTMFWTTKGLENDATRFEEYVSVCRAITPTWKDNKKPD